MRKLNSILGALTVQIEDGGDHPEVNRLLLEALRAGIRHQVDERQATGALRAIDAFERAEAGRWEQVKAGTLPPIQLTPEERLDDLIQDGYDLLRAHQTAAACDRWLEAWELVKHMATPSMSTTPDFDQAYPGMLQSIFNWSSDLEMELGNAGLGDPTYHQHRVRYVDEFLVCFPGEGDNRYVNFQRAKGEALWRLGRRAEAEAVYGALVEDLPDHAWGYIGWSDEYYLWRDAPKDYPTGEAILLRALARPELEDREVVFDRLARLYEEWGRPEKKQAVAAELAALRDGRAAAGKSPRSPGEPAAGQPGARKLKRNDPCWCGSGKKYKHCHMNSDA